MVLVADDTPLTTSYHVYNSNSLRIFKNLELLIVNALNR